MEVSFDTDVIKCSDCEHNIQLKIGKFVGGMNDYGGWVIRCKGCGGLVAVQAKNPDDISSVVSGGTVVDSWDDEIGNREQVFAKHGLTEEKGPQRLRVKEFGEVEDFYDPTTRALYHCHRCQQPVDQEAFAALSEQLDRVAAQHMPFLNFYLKGSIQTPDGQQVDLPFRCVCGEAHRAQFHREFAEDSPRRTGEFWLVDVDGTADSIDIDGVYSRDECITILEKLLLRWRATHEAVLLAAPFIGFNYPGARKKVPDLWNWILKYTDPDRTSLITRKATFTLFKQVSEGTAMDVEFLDSWGLLNPTLRALTKKKARFKQKFHAKFYCGMSTDRVEVLVGSFNIHRGEYVENIHLRSYNYEEFARRYLVGMALTFDKASLPGPRRPHVIRL